jgi:hypothetical protein
MLSRRVYVGRGLSRAEALRKALAKSPGDHRGFKYSRRTGYATIA